MSFREKIDWLSLGAILIGFGWYFAAFPYASKGNAALGTQGGMLFAIAILMAITMTISAVALAVHKPSEANASVDERDRNIGRMAATRAYYVMIPGAAFAFASAFYTRELVIVLNMLLAASVLAECVRLSSQIFASQRGY